MNQDDFANKDVMRTEKKLNSIFFKSLSILIMFFVLLFTQACVQAPANSRKALLSSNNSTVPKSGTKLPTFTEGNNFVQNGGVIYTSTIDFDLSFTDTLQLRGKDVDGYIRNTGAQVISCLVGPFSASNQVTILAAIPHSVYNFSSQALEYYYSLSPSDGVTNKNFCQKSGLVNKLFALYPLLTQIYAISDLCPSGTCVTSSFSSQALIIFSQSGSPITQIATNQLSYTIHNRPNITSPIGQTCVGNTECKTSGYDCCSLGQCVKDLALKPGVDQASTNFVQSLQDILNNPSHIYLYPQYYYICSTPVTQPSNPTTPVNAVNQANARLSALTDLYNCTTKIEGELGICTKTISNALIGTIYSAGIDDRNFLSTYTNQPSTSVTPTAPEDLITIQEISYGEVTLFSYDQITNESLVRPDPFVVSTYLTINGHHNDDNATGARILIPVKPPGAVSDDLVIKYRTDASCVQVNSNLGKCEKYYVQGQQNNGDTIILNRRGRVTDHFPASNIFKLPYYASTNQTIKVEVDGIPQRQDIDWQLNEVSPANIQFLSSANGLKVFDTQKVKITFFVDLSVNHVMDSKLEALNKIKDTCHCADLNCALAPVKNTSGAVIDYACIYPDPAPIVPPVSQQIFLSSKTVPVRYFDSTGSSKSLVTGATLPQEGTAFLYRKDNLLNPNNMPDITNTVIGENTYIGFNEIYGSLSYTNNSAKAAREVPLTKGKTYDIYVDKGTYSNCVQCGNDYNSQLNKLFPLTQFGGGLVPLQARTDRSQANGVRADDMSFGRACFVPATMIPFSHSAASDPQEQRLNRMRAQHFLYANGYQHDWYGFDYGAVIGSFDGVKWFAIGTNRRIKADTNKLFIAINGPFGDLALESTFTVTVNDGSLNPLGSNLVTTDLESDGAQCQKFHQCSTDNDCATTLGWDYACANVSEITTSWPTFDQNAKEIPDAVRDDNRLISILNTSSAGKRCIYRGRGAACTPNYLSNLINVNSTFNQTQDQSFHTCSSNTYCQTLSTGTSLNSNFNNRIARYGKVRTDQDSDSFGLGAKVPGRPMEFNALEPMRSETVRNFNSNKLSGLCIPGRFPEATTFATQNATTPPPEYTGDKILGIGMSFRKDFPTFDKAYLASCGIMDSTKNYFYAKGDPSSNNTTNSELINSSGAQAVSTNALNVFKSIFTNKGISFGLFTNNSTHINTQTFTENRCMRAPGASCFTDLDCAPSKVLANRIKMVNSEDTIVNSFLNKYEVKFWQEELVCSQATSKSDPAYSSFNNRCCRDVGQTISLPSGFITKDPLLNATQNLNMSGVPGIDYNISRIDRYSRVATVYKDQIDDPVNFPILQAPVADQCTTSMGCMNVTVLPNQFKTFSTYAERTSCSGSWIRNFESTGKHVWSSSLFQSFNPTLLFQCMNWLPASDNNTCAGREKDDPGCTIIQTSPFSAKAKGVFNYLGKLELMGIPQIAIESEDFFNGTEEGDMSCRSFPTRQGACYPGNSEVPCTNFTVSGQTSSSGNYAFPTGLFKLGADREYVDTSFAPAPSKQLYSGADNTSFLSMKKIFKSDDVSTCIAAGTTMAVGADANLCCTGFINKKNNKCQLPDFVDVSVYTNRYVSSEAKGLNISLFDQNGYVKDPDIVVQLACEKSMCASGVMAFGVLVSKLKIPGQKAFDTKLNRFLEGASDVDDENNLLTLYTQGLKINSHAYCFPGGSTSGSGDDVRIIPCN